MSMPKLVRAGILLLVFSVPVFAQTPNLGKPVTSAEIAGWDINILPDGTGLPFGSGTHR